ncbi:MAG: bifunctional phosphoglucose/phosphomannose isomerase [Deltaproteobacteria bacterium]|nr:bifunctional phosphoglucose/phosphomannose isomerase [Deltaproteobacteria bacterium]
MLERYRAELQGRIAIYQTIRQFPEQFLKSWKLLRESKDLAPWRRLDGAKIFYAAMGGSSLPADLLNDYFEGAFKLELIRDYQLPKSANSDDLVIAASFSGNTEETLSVFEEAQRKHCRLIALSNGGKLKEMAEAAKVPWIPIPDCIQPRCATGYFFATLMGLLHRLGILEDSPEPLFTSLEDYLEVLQDASEARGKELASALKDRVPIIYGPSNFAGAARIWKIKFNENAKIQSFSNVFPELNHNEMVGFTRLILKPALIFLESRFMDPRIHRRMDVTQELLEKDIPIHRLSFKGQAPVFEMFESLAIADFASYYLAKDYGIDPAPVEMVEAFKKAL